MVESGESGGVGEAGAVGGTGETEGQLRVLVVDDNIDAANSLAMLLTLTEGYDVRVAYDGLSAFEAALEHQPQVLLLDLGLPGQSGFDLARQLREQNGFRHALIIALTGWGMERDRIRSRDAGFDQHLVKPVEPDLIRDIVRSYRRSDRVGAGDPS